jgi:hypothetical protein
MLLEHFEVSFEENVKTAKFSVTRLISCHSINNQNIPLEQNCTHLQSFAAQQGEYSQFLTVKILRGVIKQRKVNIK